MTLEEALEQACREEYAGFTANGLGRHVETDRAAATYGALVPRIAYILYGQNRDTSGVLRKLKAMESRGEVIKRQYRKGGMARWWPVGLLDRLRGEAA